MEIRPVDLRKVQKNTDNLYESIIVTAKRARQINAENRLEYNTLVSTLIPAVEDDFEERGNPDLEKVSLEFEKRPKPHMQALDELIDEKIKFRYKEDEN